MYTPRKALAFILEAFASREEGCFHMPFPQKRVYFLSSQRTPQWVSTQMHHGLPEPGQVPVRMCGTSWCINGAHYVWGSQGDANSARSMPDQNGEKNPASKLTALEVAQLRSINWRGGYYKSLAAEAAGISMKTLAQVLNGHTWKGVTPYLGAEEWALSGQKDEF